MAASFSSMTFAFQFSSLDVFSFMVKVGGVTSFRVEKKKNKTRESKLSGE
jgi:hypothetical protein